MKNYLLDTCTISDFFKGVGKTSNKLRSKTPGQIAISSVSSMEILYGFELNNSARRKFGSAFKSLCSAIHCYPFDENAAQVAAELRAKLKLAGKPIGALDLLIASTALSNNCILVSSNCQEFERIEGLELENWR